MADRSMRTFVVVGLLLLGVIVIARAVGTKKERLLRKRQERQHRRFQRHLLEGRYRQERERKVD